jgi:hypothetical protein
LILRGRPSYIFSAIRPASSSRKGSGEGSGFIHGFADIQVISIGGRAAMLLRGLIAISTVFIFAIIFPSCNPNQEEQAAERYRDMVKSSTGKTISVSQAMEMLKKLENEKSVKSNEIEQTMNLLKAKYDYKIFPPEELQGRMMFTFIIRDYLLKDDRNVLFVGQLEDITSEDGQFSVHLSSQLQLSDGRIRKKARFHLRCPLESIEPIINHPPVEPPVLAGFQKQYFVICKVSDLYKVTSYSPFNSDNERIGSEILVDAVDEFQIEGDLVEIIPYPK